MQIYNDIVKCYLSNLFNLSNLFKKIPTFA